MKSFRTALLAAAVTAGVPAMVYAQDAPQDQSDRHHDRGGNPGGRPDGGQRPDGGARQWSGGQRPDRGAPPAPQPQAQPQPQAPVQPQVRGQDVQRPAPQGAPDRGNFGNGRPYGRFAPGQQPGQYRDYRNRDNDRGQSFDGNRGAPPPPTGNPDNRDHDRDRDWRDNRGGPPPGFRPDRPGNFAPGNPGRPGWQQPNGNWRPPNGNWRGPDWRQDRRYDWRNFRDLHRDIFRGPRYVAPRGWGYGYRRFDIGYRLPPFLFAQDYWIADPWVYRLPPVDGPYRWVRYYNDVLLIDLRTGEVVDSIQDFFF